jgi:group I intron endonuclease
MNSKESGIYSITSKINGKRYIGSSIRICARWIQHKNDLKGNRHHSQYLQNHYNKYGQDDLIFSVVEIIERNDLSLTDFKQLLLNTEQNYLNNWNECQFNCLKIAGSPLGEKRSGSKYYRYINPTYSVHYNLDGKRCYFGSFDSEQEAIMEVEYIKSLSYSELIIYQKDFRIKQKSKKQSESKNYSFDKKTNKWRVRFKINNKTQCFGYFETEQNAIDKVNEIKIQLGYAI